VHLNRKASTKTRAADVAVAHAFILAFVGVVVAGVFGGTSATASPTSARSRRPPSGSDPRRSVIGAAGVGVSPCSCWGKEAAISPDI